MDHQGDAGSLQHHSMWDCDGNPIDPVGGSWVGHFVPGLLMLVWGMHWAFATFHSYLSSSRGVPGGYQSKAAHRVLLLPERLLLEPWMKATLPCVAMLLELWLGHPEYRCAGSATASSRGSYSP